MVESAWLDEGDCVIREKLVDGYIKYIKWIEKHYPNIHKKCINEIIELKELS